MAKLSFSDKLKKLFGLGVKDTEFFEELSDSLIESDIGPKLAYEIVSALESVCKKKNIFDEQVIREELKEIVSSYVMEKKLELSETEINFVLILGVNGVGKTTSIAKLAKYFSSVCKFENIILAAGDTFRAAAIDQLVHHGEKLNLRVVKQQHGSDPGAVIYDSINAAVSCNSKLILADTAGRLHNKINLIKELEKIHKIIEARVVSSNYKKILVIDATTGQNGLEQARVFHEAVHLDGFILTKYDSSAKGGLVLSIAKELDLPCFFTGTGEKYEDLHVFSKDEYVRDFCGINS